MADVFQLRHVLKTMREHLVMNTGVHNFRHYLSLMDKNVICAVVGLNP